jgi:Holliday junction resolvase RusA-like endonuclease
MRQKIVLINERPMSVNKIYSGMHWAKRNAEAHRVHLLVRAELDPEAAIADQPVAITVTCYFKSHPLDASNIGAKMYEDALIGLVIQDDGPKYVTSMTTRSRVDKQRPRVEIEIETIE